MKESHVIEFKESWRDEYLKWICGFANAEGGVLVIGKNDQGVPVGAEHSAKLLQDLPNKIRDVLGVMADVRLVKEAGKELVEIRVDSYPSPVSYRGEYHYRSGSTKQELKGAALDRFLLRKYGRTWDSVPVPDVALRDLSKPALALFRKLARQGKRLESGLLRESSAAVIEKLNLVERGQLKRAALLLFHSDPERFFAGAFIKIGFFRGEADLLYHDEIHGDLFTQAQKVMDVLLTKYLKAAISYRGIQRIESYPVPEEALREALLNALIHRDYAIAAPIQIRVHDDRLCIWNPGELPETWTVRKLLSRHSSRPFNPFVANAFFRAGEIEAWGRGIQRIVGACREAGAPEPKIQYNPGDFWFEFPYASAYLKIVPAAAGTDGARATTPVETPVKTPVKTPDRILGLLKAQPSLGLVDVARVIGKSVRAVERASAQLARQGRLRHVGPRKGGHWEVTGG